MSHTTTPLRRAIALTLLAATLLAARPPAIPAQPAPTTAVYLPLLIDRGAPVPPVVITRQPTATTTAPPPHSPTPASSTTTATASPPSTVTPTATPTFAQPTVPPSPTATPTGPTPTPSPTPTAAPRDPAGERLRPNGADRPGTIEVAFDPDRRRYQLVHRGAIELRYEIELGHPDVAAGRLTVREVTSGRYPMAGAGLYYRTEDGALVEPRHLGRHGTVDTLTHTALPDGVQLTVRETLEGQPHTKRYTVRLRGRSLRVDAASLDPAGIADGAYAGFTAGVIETSGDVVSLRVPYMERVPLAMLDRRWFASTLLDLSTSHAAALLPRGPAVLPGAFRHEVAALYPPDAVGRTRPVSETLWVTLSPQVEDTFAVPETSAGPGRSLMSRNVHLALEQAPPDGFAALAERLDQLRAWRIEDLVVHLDGWRDSSLPRPAQGPPAPAAGGADGLSALAMAANGRLIVSNAYSTTVRSCPDAPNDRYRPGDRVFDALGAPKRLTDPPAVPGCDDPDAAPIAYLLAPDVARTVAEAAVADLAALGVGGVSLGHELTWSPSDTWPGATGNILDRLAATQHPATVGQAVIAYRRLFDVLGRGLGAVVGRDPPGLWEPRADGLYAGYADGLFRALSTGDAAGEGGGEYLVVPDYELSVVRPRSVGLGMGHYRRFFSADVPRPLSDGQLDHWRATTLSYGHAGLLWLPTDGGPPYLTDAETAKGYFLARAIGRRTLDVPLVSVRYRGPDGVERPLSYALANDFDLAGPQLHLVYGNGLELWVNHAADTWTVVLGGEDYRLPQHGWLARGQGGFIGYSAEREGRRVDYLWSPEWVLLDGRGEEMRFGGDLVARDLIVVFPDGARLVEGANGVLELVGP